MIPSEFKTTHKVRSHRIYNLYWNSENINPVERGIFQEKAKSKFGAVCHLQYICSVKKLLVRFKYCFTEPPKRKIKLEVKEEPVACEESLFIQSSAEAQFVTDTAQKVTLIAPMLCKLNAF